MPLEYYPRGIDPIAPQSVELSASGILPLSPGLPKSGAPIPISIISNSRLFHEGLATLLQPYLAIQLLASYFAEPIPVSRVESPKGHVALVDAGIGERLSILWTHYWRKASNPAYVLMLEMTDDVPTILASIEAGANGYTLRTASAEEVAQTITVIHSGGVQCSAPVMAHLFARLAALKALQTEPATLDMPLTTREFQVLGLITKGYSNKQIALELVVTLRTVKHHVHNILDKLKVRFRRDAVQIALQRGWVDPTAKQLVTHH